MKMNLNRALRLPILLVALGVGLSGCATADRGGSAAFATGVAAARAQTKTAFDATRELTRTRTIERALGQKELVEASLKLFPSRAVVAEWERVLGAIEAYARVLASLQAGDSAKQVESALGGLAVQFNATAAQTGSSQRARSGPVTMLSQVSNALLRTKGRRKAAEVAAQTDVAIRQVLLALAEGIGSNPDEELRGTVRAVWEERQTELGIKFKETEKPEERRKIITEFSELLQRRDAQDQVLANLRGTYLTLADAHTALARGNSADLSGAVGFITEELKHARELKERLARTLPP